MFSDDTELFPLSTLLYNRAQEHPKTVPPAPWTLVGDVLTWNSDSDIESITIYSDTPQLKIKRRGFSITLHTLNVGEDWHMDDGNTISYRASTDVYWSDFGIEYVELPDNTPLVHSIWDRICLRVNEAYYDRFLGGETLEQWQRRLQVITDRIIPRYERNFRIYEVNRQKLETELGMTQTTEYLDVKDVNTTDNESKVSETPDTAINENQNYAGSVSTGTGKTTNTKTGKVKMSMTPTGGLIEQLNDNMDAWRDLESDLVEEYAKAFLSTIWF